MGADGSVVESFTHDQGVTGSNLAGKSCIISLQDYILYLVLVQSRKTHPDMTEILFAGT